MILRQRKAGPNARAPKVIAEDDDIAVGTVLVSHRAPACHVASVILTSDKGEEFTVQITVEDLRRITNEMRAHRGLFGSI